MSERTSPNARFEKQFRESFRKLREEIREAHATFREVQSETYLKWLMGDEARAAAWFRKRFDPRQKDAVASWIRDLSSMAPSIPLTIQAAIRKIAEGVGRRLLQVVTAADAMTSQQLVLSGEPITLAADTAERDAREISLVDALGLSAEDVERELPWTGPAIRLYRDTVEGETKFLATATGERPKKGQARNLLRVTLVADDGRHAEAVLGGLKSAEFTGDPLPSEWERLWPILSLEEPES